LARYNAMEKPTNPQVQQTLTRNEISDPGADAWIRLHLQIDQVPIDPEFCLKLSAIRENGMLLSAKKEKKLLRSELENLRSSYAKKIDCLDILSKDTDLPLCGLYRFHSVELKNLFQKLAKPEQLDSLQDMYSVENLDPLYYPSDDEYESDNDD